MFRKHIKKVKYLFDDSAVQYKNYKRFMNLCHHYTILIRKTGGLFFLEPFMENLLLMGRKDNNIVVNPFVPNASFFYPLKTSENLGFLMFSGGSERVHWERMG